jgi:hypothetical protein
LRPPFIEHALRSPHRRPKLSRSSGQSHGPSRAGGGGGGGGTSTAGLRTGSRAGGGGGGGGGTSTLGLRTGVSLIEFCSGARYAHPAKVNARNTTNAARMSDPRRTAYYPIGHLPVFREPRPVRKGEFAQRARRRRRSESRERLANEGCGVAGDCNAPRGEAVPLQCCRDWSKDLVSCGPRKV